MAIPEIPVSSLDDLAAELLSLYSETGHRWWFRGHASVDWKLLPSVRRGHSPEQERYLANEFYMRARTRHHRCPENDDYAGWLSLMQHYRLPTRLLDWSRSPLVAAFFATRDEHGMFFDDTEPAVIWALQPETLNASQHCDRVFYPLNAGRLRSIVRAALKSGDDEDVVIAALPLEFDMRMLMQQSAFTVHGSSVALEDMPGMERWLRKFVIPIGKRHHIAQQLNVMGVQPADIFPDLEHLAHDLSLRHHV